MVTVVLPTIILHVAPSHDTRWSDSSGLVQLSRLTAAAFLLLGLMLVVLTNLLFARIGKGTLAPWDATSQLVVAGPYRFVRNPMISGVAMILAAESLFFGSVFMIVYTLLFLTINHLYLLFSEESGLEKRFGQAYRLYKAHVPRWIPRKTPWEAE